MESAIGFQVRDRGSVLMLLIMFLRNILFRSNTSSSDVTISSDVKPVSIRILENFRLQEPVNKLTQTGSFKKKVLKSVVFLLHQES